MPVEFRNIEPPTSWQIFPRHPAGEDYADLSKVLARRMQGGIEKYGVMLRPVVLKREQNGLFVLDGWQMYQACIAANVKPEFVELVAGIDPKEFVEIKNDCRRHESVKDRTKRLTARRAKSKEMKAAGMTVVKIAKELGVGRAAIQRDLANGKLRCERCTSMGLTGDDCPRCQLMRMDTPKDDSPEEEEESSTTSEEEKPKPAPAPPKPPELPTVSYDANFVIIPEHVSEAFVAAATIRHFCHEFDRLHKELSRLMSAKVGTRYISPTMLQRLVDYRQHFWQSRPTHICPYCQGRQDDSIECTACKGQGWVSAAAFANAPKEFQDQMRQMGARNVPI